MDDFRVCVLYVPWFYSDLFQKILQKLSKIQVIENAWPERSPWKPGNGRLAQADLIILSLNHRGLPALDLLPDPLPDVELIAFSPYGDRGFQRKAGERTWQRLQPFGVPELMQLVQDRKEQHDHPWKTQELTPGD